MRRPWPVVRVRRCVVPSLCGYWVATFSRRSYRVPHIWSVLVLTSGSAPGWRRRGGRVARDGQVRARKSSAMDPVQPLLIVSSAANGVID